jgi:hypothetical protein
MFLSRKGSSAKTLPIEAPSFALAKDAAAERAPTSTGRRVIVDKGLSPASKNAQPLDRISPMQHGFERMINPVRPLLWLADFFLLDLSPVLLPYSR